MMPRTVLAVWSGDTSTWKVLCNTWMRAVFAGRSSRGSVARGASTGCWRTGTSGVDGSSYHSLPCPPTSATAPFAIAGRTRPRGRRPPASKPKRMEGIRVHHPGDQHAADVGAAQRREDDEGDKENGDRRFDADLAKGPAGVGRVRHAARAPALLERDEVEAQKRRRRGRQPDDREEDEAGAGVVDDLHRQDGAGREERDEAVAPPKDPPTGPEPGDREHQQQADQEQQVGLVGESLKPLLQGGKRAARGQRRRREEQQRRQRSRKRSDEVGEPATPRHNEQPPQPRDDRR